MGRCEAPHRRRSGRPAGHTATSDARADDESGALVALTSLPIIRSAPTGASRSNLVAALLPAHVVERVRWCATSAPAPSCAATNVASTRPRRSPSRKTALSVTAMARPGGRIDEVSLGREGKALEPIRRPRGQRFYDLSSEPVLPTETRRAATEAARCLQPFVTPKSRIAHPKSTATPSPVTRRCWPARRGPSGSPRSDIKHHGSHHPWVMCGWLISVWSKPPTVQQSSRVVLRLRGPRAKAPQSLAEYAGANWRAGCETRLQPRAMQPAV